MGSKTFYFNLATGKIGDEVSAQEQRTPAQKALDEF